MGLPIMAGCVTACIWTRDCSDAVCTEIPLRHSIALNTACRSLTFCGLFFALSLTPFGLGHGILSSWSIVAWYSLLNRIGHNISGGQKFDKLTCLLRWHPMTVPRWKSIELFSTDRYPASGCLWRLHGGVLDFIHLLATDVATVAESTNLTRSKLQTSVRLTIVFA